MITIESAYWRAIADDTLHTCLSLGRQTSARQPIWGILALPIVSPAWAPSGCLEWLWRFKCQVFTLNKIGKFGDPATFSQRPPDQHSTTLFISWHHNQTFVLYDRRRLAYCAAHISKRFHTFSYVVRRVFSIWYDNNRKCLLRGCRRRYAPQ